MLNHQDVSKIMIIHLLKFIKKDGKGSTMPIKAVGIALLIVLSISLVIVAVSGMVDSGISQLISASNNAPSAGID